MKVQQLSREARMRRALERWENEGGRVVSKGDKKTPYNESVGRGTVRTKRA